MATGVVPCPACGTKNRLPGAAKGHPRCASCKADLPWLVDAGDDDFDAAADTRLLVVVDLWAPWCGPCRMVAPVLEAISRDYAGRVKVVKVNVDHAAGLARRFDAQSIPTLVMLSGGAVVDRVVGALPGPALRSRVDAVLARLPPRD